jgi:hypothetical protein
MPEAAVSATAMRANVTFDVAGQASEFAFQQDLEVSARANVQSGRRRQSAGALSDLEQLLADLPGLVPQGLQFAAGHNAV